MKPIRKIDAFFAAEDIKKGNLIVNDDGAIRNALPEDGELCSSGKIEKMINVLKHDNTSKDKNR